MATVRCWHCNTENDPVATSGFCDRCGRKLEDVPQTGIADAPGSRRERNDNRFDRDRDYRDPYAADVRRNGGSQEARKLLTQASGVLFGVATLQFVCGLVGVFALPKVMGIEPGPLFLAIAVFVVVAIAGAYVGLGIWARYQPLPATIIGLVLYLMVFTANMVMADDPGMIVKGIWLPILIIVMLVQGIVAANKYNKLKERYQEDY
jgi:hypothetical protein